MFDLTQQGGSSKREKQNFSPFPEFSPSLSPGPRIDKLPMLRAQQQAAPAPKFDFIPSHVPYQAPAPYKPNYQAAFIKNTVGSLLGRAVTPLVERITGRKVDLSTLPEAKTLGEKAVGMVGSLGADLPLWLGGDALLAKPLSMLAKTKPIAKGIGLLPKKALPALTTGARATATFGGPINALETAMSGDGLEGFKGRLKEAPLMGLGGVALHGAGQVLGKGIKAGVDFNRFKGATKLPETKLTPLEDIQNAFKPVALRDAKAQQLNKTFANTTGNLGLTGPTLPKQGMNPTELLQNKQANAQSVFGQPRDVNKYSFTTSEQRAFQELQDGITEAQNYARHTDVLAPYPAGTTVEAAYADVKANTGVDLPQLMENWNKTQSLKTQMTPEELRLGKVAGVVPPLKPRDIPKPMQNNLEGPLPRAQVPKDRLTWANRDNIPSAGQLPIRSITPENIGRLPQEIGSRLSPRVEVPGNNLGPNFRQGPGANAIESQTLESDQFIDALKIKDIGNFKAYDTDFFRIAREALGKDAGNEFSKPLDLAKGANIDMQTDLTSRLKTDIVDGLGIKKGSKESALVQRYGEGEITLEELKGLSPQWEKILKANDWFRKEYDNLIDQVNASKREIYPNAETSIANIDARISKAKLDPKISATERRDLLKELDVKREDAMRGKIIPKRADYFRHFQEMAEGVKGLMNIFDSPAGISTQLIGSSEFTRPRSKWASFAQKRLGNKTEEDAVGGFLNYIPSASYATHIDPQVAKLREFTQVLRDTTAESHNADTFIGFLDKYANDLAGKTNPVDRVIQDMIPGGRKTFAVLTWLNNRVKANVILGKAGTMLAQLANIPSGAAFAKQYSVPGLINSVKAITKPSEAMKSSAFLKERFSGSLYSQFNESLLGKPKDFAIYLMTMADKAGTSFVWNSAYAKGLGEKVADPIRFADMATRDLVAGRGIGEVPLIQKSKLFQLVAPFQLEVANLWKVQKDFLNAKDFGGLISLFLLNYGFNEVMMATRGSRVTYDPINAIKEASKEGLTPLQRGGRLAGEVLSNVPLGQTAAAAYPEYGAWGGPSRKELFGSTDPTRFGSGLLAIKAAQDPLAKLVLPFGGEQVKKTYQGIKDLKAGGHIVNGKLSYPVEPTISNKIKGTLFGPSAFNEAKPYYKNNLRPLSVKQTEEVSKSPGEYNKIMVQRKIDSLETKIKDVQKDAKLSKSDQLKKISDLKSQILDAERGR